LLLPLAEGVGPVLAVAEGTADADAAADAESDADADADADPDSDEAGAGDSSFEQAANATARHSAARRGRVIVCANDSNAA